VQDSLLSISIPTRDRALAVKQNISRLIPAIKKYNISLYISDGSTDDKTYKIYLDLNKAYKNIFYHKVPNNSGHDFNIVNAIQIVDSKYVWVLGDSVKTDLALISNIINIIKEFKPTIIGVNSINRKINLQTGNYSDYNEVLLKLGWHLTLTGTTIYQKSSLNKTIKFNLNNFRNFPQIHLIFDSLIERPSFYWVNDYVILVNRNKKKSYWSNKLFDVFLDDWSNAIHNLVNNYSYRLKLNVIKSHDKKTDIFSLRSLALARSEGNFSLKILIKFYNKMSLNFLKFFLLCFISIFPQKILRGWRIISSIIRN